MADKKWHDVEYHEGDEVLLKLHPYRQQNAFKSVYQKLSSWYHGPYKSVFHVSLLKPYHQEEFIVVNTMDLSPFMDEGLVMLEPRKILDTRWIKLEAKLMEENLVQWKHLLAEEATWELSQRSYWTCFRLCILRKKIHLRRRVMIC